MATILVKYKGYVYTDIKGNGRPGMDQINLAHTMMLKKNVSKTRQLHPLFVRGFDKTSLTMEISEAGVYVVLPKSKKDAEDQCLMNQQLHRIAFCAGISKNLYIMIKRAGSGASAGKFKCHGFTLDSEAQALEITKLLSRVTNEAFAKLRHVTRLLEAKAKKNGGPPALAKRTVVKDEDQPWYHGKMSRQEAEKLLIDGNLINGLFLVRQSERSESDFALSFAYQKKCYHNRILKTAEGTFKNTKGSAWPSLSNLVMDYQSPHEDMQTIITNYVSNKPQTQDDGQCSYVNIALVKEKAAELAAGAKRWDTSDLQNVLSEITAIDSPASEGGVTDIAFDPIYDDVSFGFGDEFISATLGNFKGGVQPTPELDLDNVMFSCGEIEGEADC